MYPSEVGYYVLIDGSWLKTDGLTFRTWFNTVNVFSDGRVESNGGTVLREPRS